MANGIVLPNARMPRAQANTNMPLPCESNAVVSISRVYDVFGLVLMYAMFAHIELGYVVCFDSDGGGGVGVGARVSSR